VRKAAEELLKKLGRDVAGEELAGAKGANDTPEKVQKARPKGGTTASKQPGRNDNDKRGKGKAASEDATAGKGKDGGQNKGKQGPDRGQVKNGNRAQGDRVGRGQAGTPDELKANPVDEAASRRAGELQLESLRDKLKKNPGLWKQMKWKDEKDVERFIQRAREYQQWLREQEKRARDDTRPATAGKNVLPGFGPTRVGERPARTRDPLELGGAQPPPEFREAQRLFTSKTPR
jgi:hypothetical protein